MEQDVIELKKLRGRVKYLLFLLHPIDWECVTPDETECEDIKQAISDIDDLL